MNRRALIMAGLAGSAFGLSGMAKAEPRPDYENKLKELGITLPDAPSPVANYVPFRRVGSLLYIAGQGPAITAGGKVIGTLGKDLGIKDGYGAARSAGLNVLAQLRSALGSLNALHQCVKLGGFVNSADDFHDQPAVINGASDLFVEVFGAAGKHARFAVGVNTLPFNVAVEIESVWEVWP